MRNSNLELLRVFRDSHSKNVKVEVKCKLCGKTNIMWRSHYYRGDTPCDCNHWKKHNPRLYSIYSNIKTRCYNEHSPNYKNYGERGITMCNEWLESFEKFKDWALHNGYSDELTIERVDVNGNYEPSNCKWILPKEQAKNKRTTIRVENESLRAWCIKHDISYKLVHQYMKRHPELSLDEVLDYYKTKYLTLEVYDDFYRKLP